MHDRPGCDDERENDYDFRPRVYLIHYSVHANANPIVLLRTAKFAVSRGKRIIPQRFYGFDDPWDRLRSATAIL
jgi:hypothetical protein